jgi:calcineurin-like phosphoesterase family protein
VVYLGYPLNFGHKNIIKYCNRPYDSVEEMDESIITNWNSVVEPLDIVYHLGDFSFRKPLDYINRLNGYIKIIPGSHDKEIQSSGAEMMLRKFVFSPISEISVDIDGRQQSIVLCHYSMRKWDKSHYGSWHLWGHSHGNLPAYGLSFDVGVDTNNFYPYSLKDVATKMKTLSREFVLEQYR